MKHRTVAEEQRSGTHWIVVGIVLVALAFVMWWLVANTNKEGHHDAQLLPLFALIPVGIGLLKLGHARFRGRLKHG